MHLNTPRPLVIRLLVTLFVLAAVGCSNLLSPDGHDVPRDPGTLVVHVRDQFGAPVPGAWVSVEMPNSVGSAFTVSSPTDSGGSRTFYYVAAGDHRVDVRPPSGFSAGATPLVQDVRIVKGQSITADFALVRTVL